MVSADSAERSSDLTSGAVRQVHVPMPSAWWVLICGVTGLLASGALTVEKVRILLDPSYVPACNINPIVSCGSVMTTAQASLLGFPNQLFGIAAFTVVVVTGVLAVTKVPLPRWYWVGLTIGVLVGTVFVHWLIFESLYRIGSLCPYCMVVWIITATLLVVVGSIAFRPDPDSTSGAAVRVLFQWRWSIATLWLTAVFLLIMVRFWNYWSTLL
ncbi:MULTISPECIES: vitamin K epoxide reductase family protein [Mycobacterium ulcerans group]|uniref:Membrane protein n=1 Tax=Mycobacterium shottsii TaxID=133549 RepID=A0A7I7LKZ1_9MYCO|nr:MULTISPECIES: vitamin K epoxide reductase family protein [Mycobacterium ulcerans group]AXN43704.1 Vitamin K epoxide reductase family protein [Mycobacterium marinum]AXN49072.1 Vitamin K epoxide reductase family protein [Mycobacterium marinum]MDC8972818.1 vitamin K epoxide reductase family protein [Mycobacterium marinum]MDC9003419.1 vitamin K epoxide reductase family protein [Mycobacterium marinum]QQW34962.1 vitamin K epoxide reductase family protein [Mycobacterium marinum]